jgi:hypothetical protein
MSHMIAAAIFHRAARDIPNLEAKIPWTTPRSA